MKKLSLAIVCVLMTAAWTRSAQQPQPLPDCPDLVRALQDMVRADSRIRDFADLRRYREANRDSSARIVRVVFMGDSITDFWNRLQFGGFFPGKPYADRGISGQTTPQMLLRFRPDVIALHPDVVVILAGTNDIAGNTGPMTDAEIEGNLTSMCELAQASRIRVVLSSITPVGEAHRRAPARIVAINTWLRAYAAEHHPVYLDYYAAMVDERGLLQADLSEDDLHPNAKGYAVMAPLAEAAVQRALAIAWR